MGAYINKAELLKELSVIQDRPVRSAMQIIKILPTIDIVRCKECKHRDPEDKKCDSGMLERQGCIFPVADDYFCKYGERRSDEEKS